MEQLFHRKDRGAGYVISTEQMKMILTMPKAENHIHIEGSILPRTVLRLAARNKVPIPVDSEEAFCAYLIANVQDLRSFMVCDRLFNSVCMKEIDYEEVIFDLAMDAREQNILYQEYFLDYPLNEARGIPLEIVMEGYRSGQRRAREELGVEIVYLAGIDRTQPLEQCADFIRNMTHYRDMVAGIGMDCEEAGHPCRNFSESYRLAAEMDLFRTAHAGEDYAMGRGDLEIWDALQILGVQRVDHGCQAVKSPELMDYLAQHEILMTICPTANVGSHNVASYAEHPVKEFLRRGIPCSINSDDPPYSGDLVQQYARMLSLVGVSEEDLIHMARNAFAYSIHGQKYLPIFDAWYREWQTHHDGFWGKKAAVL